MKNFNCMNKTIGLIVILLLKPMLSSAQESTITGVIYSDGNPVSFVNIGLLHTNKGAVSNNRGEFKIKNVPAGSYTLSASHIGYDHFETNLAAVPNKDLNVVIELKKNISGLDELVVTGVTKTTKARENPISVKSITPAQIQQTPAANIMDVLAKNTPGLDVVKTGPNISKPFIRGLGYNRVLTLYDGIRQEGQQWGDEHGMEIDAYNIERAEIIKGPASLMYGSDALAGVVSFFPAVPTFIDGKIKGRVISEYQANNGLIGNGLNLGYNNGKFLLGLRGSYRLAKNYQNPKDGRVYLTNFNESNLSAIAGIQTKSGYTHLNLTFYDNSQAIPDGSRDSLSGKFTKQIYEEELDDNNIRPIVSDRELNSYRIPDLSQHIRHYRIYTNSFYAAGNGDISLTLGLQQNLRTEYDHPTAPDLPAMNIKLNTLNYGIRYNAPSFAGIETALGINGMLQKNKNLEATDFPIPDYNLSDGGMYTHLKWNSRQLTISGGVRYDIRHLHWYSFYITNNPLTGFDTKTSQHTAGATLQFEDTRKTFNDISASLGMTYKFSKQVSIKANLGRAFRAPNITELASNGLDPGARIIYLGDKSFKPEFSTQKDIGFLFRYHSFSADLSFFNNSIDNFIYLSAVAGTNGKPLTDAQGNRTYRYMQSKAQLYGSEIWLALHPEILPGLRADNSLSVVYGFNRNHAFKGHGTNGEYLPLIPPLQLSSTLSYEIKPDNSKWLQKIIPKAGIEHNNRQTRYLGLNGSESETAGYTLVNAGIRFTIKYSTNNTFDIHLQIDNLFNKSYQNHLSRLKYFEEYEGKGIYNMGRNTILRITMPI